MDLDLLLVADPDLDADLTEATDDHLEGLDQDSLCICDHGPADHDDRSGCQASGCRCPALGLQDLAGAIEDGELEAEEEQLAQRVAAARATAIKRRRLQDHERATAAAEDAARRSLVEKAPRRDKPDSRGAAASPPPPPAEISLSDTYGLSLLEKDALEALGGAVLN